MNQQAVTELLTPVVLHAGLELDRLEIGSAGKRSVLKVFLDGDGPDGRGPSLDEIADATRAIGAALDDSPLTGSAPYVLEVSSRGVSRPLTEAKHYRRNAGRLVAFKLGDGSKLTARIVEAGADGVRVNADGTERELNYEQIGRAVVQVELNKLPTEDEFAEAGDDDEE